MIVNCIGKDRWAALIADLNIEFVTHLMKGQRSISSFLLRLQELLAGLYNEPTISQETYLQILSNSLIVLGKHGNVVFMPNIAFIHR